MEQTICNIQQKIVQILSKKRSLISLFFLSNKQTFYTLKENDKSCIYETPYAMKNPSIPEFDGWMMLPRKAWKHKNCVTNYIPFDFTGVIQILSYILSLHIPHDFFSYFHNCNFQNIYDGNQNSRIHCIQYGWLLEYFLEPSFQSMNLTGKNVMVRLLEYEP